MAEALSPPANSNITIVPAAPNKGIKMGGEIKLGTPSTPTAPAEPPKPGSAKEALSQRLKAKGAPAPVAEPPVAPAKPNEPAKPQIEPPVSTEPPKPSEAAATEPPQTPEEKKKISPWKIVDQYKLKVADLEKKLADISTAGVPKDVQERIAKAEARAKELEDEIRFVNYEKSPEFKSKYQEPYEKAWQRAMAEVGELTVNGPDGQPRQVVAQDILDLVNLPLGKARELANSLYGDFADDVMAHRKEIRSLYEQRSAALDEGKKNGAEREKQLLEQHQRTYTEISEQVKQHWAKANESALADEKNGAFFKPIEGDENWNQRLAKGFELVDRAFSENPLDPKLTADQRAGVVRRHAAVRNRAAAFGSLKYKVSQLEAKVADLTKELGQFKGTEPPTGGTRTPAANGHPPDAKSEVFGKLRSLAAR